MSDYRPKFHAGDLVRVKHGVTGVDYPDIPMAATVHSAHFGRENREAEPRSESRPSRNETTERRHVHELA